jgi:hypothetical protein
VGPTNFLDAVVNRKIPRLLREGDQIKDDETGGACNTHGKNEECNGKFCRKTGREEPLRRPRCRC